MNPGQSEASVPGGNAQATYGSFQVIAAYSVFFVLLWLFARLTIGARLIYYSLALILLLLIVVNYQSIVSVLTPLGGKRNG